MDNTNIQHWSARLERIRLRDKGWNFQLTTPEGDAIEAADWELSDLRRQINLLRNQHGQLLVVNAQLQTANNRLAVAQAELMRRNQEIIDRENDLETLRNDFGKLRVDYDVMLLKLDLESQDKEYFRGIVQEMNQRSTAALQTPRSATRNTTTPAEERIHVNLAKGPQQEEADVLVTRSNNNAVNPTRNELQKQ